MFKSGDDAIVGDGNHRLAALKRTMKKCVVQVSGNDSTFEMRPYVVTDEAFSEKISDGSLVALGPDEELGNVYLQDRKSHIFYVLSDDLAEGKTEVEKVGLLRGLFPDAKSRLTREHLADEDHLVQIFDFGTYPGSGLPKKSFTFGADGPRLYFSQGYHGFVPNADRVKPVESGNAFLVDQTLVKESGYIAKSK